mgnify:CR=1 FL=1
MDLATDVLAASTQPTGAAPGGPNTGNAIDTKGASSALIVVNAGTFTSTSTYTILVQMATDAAFTTPVTITGAVFDATTTGEYSTAFHDRVDVGRINLRDCLRNIRTSGTNGGSGDGPIAVSVLLAVGDTAKGGAASLDPSTFGPQSAAYAAAFNLQPNDDGS